MTGSALSGSPFVLPVDALQLRDAEAVLTDAAFAEAEASVIEVSGPGAVTCLQGILTNDIEAVGDNGFLYGAVLTPKGMIVCDLWATRTEHRIWLAVPNIGKAPLLGAFGKYLPPRLARPTDHSQDLGLLRLVGPAVLHLVDRLGLDLPEPGRSAKVIAGGTECVLSRPLQPAYFSLQLQVARSRLDRMHNLLRGAGILPSNPNALELARIMHGWPRLGAEIDHRTLPQEVRYDHLNGVSYTKGCYTGQETVARIHFRGHPNRELRGLVWESRPDPNDTTILQNDRPIGRVTSVAWVAPTERHIGLGLIHRKAKLRQPVMAAAAQAAVADLPLLLDT